MKTLNETTRMPAARKPSRRRRTARVARSLPRRIGRKLRELDRKWDREQQIKAAAPPVAIAGALLGIFVNRWFFALPIGVGAYLVQKPVRRWLPRIIFVGRVFIPGPF